MPLPLPVSTPVADAFTVTAPAVVPALNVNVHVPSMPVVQEVAVVETVGGAVMLTVSLGTARLVVESVTKNVATDVAEPSATIEDGLNVTATFAVPAAPAGTAATTPVTTASPVAVTNPARRKPDFDLTPSHPRSRLPPMCPSPRLFPPPQLHSPVKQVRIHIRGHVTRFRQPSIVVDGTMRGRHGRGAS